ncbi:MAG: TRAP transporter substrate-binding protein [Pseudomonadota bacterium]|nr:TRAP transporter substrate-binding protein [Pseudomonadota bacterium]MEE3101070.1 TRAP transporter substrate-binding protein [Pseudomonadota bacterium]
MERRRFLTGAALGGAAAVSLAAPAIAQARKEMIIVSTWPRDFPGVGMSAQRLADRITTLSDGAIVTQYFAAGERVGAFDAFDEVASGNAQAYSAAEYYWAGKHPSFSYFSSVPFGMTNPEWSAWLKHLGGQALWDELSGEFGVKALPAGSTGSQAGGWFNKEIESVDDLRGLKMRIPGLGGSVMSKLGVSVVSLPGGQIYEALVSGAIEATEWVGPYNDYFMKFFDAAKYYYTGGMHEPGGGMALGMNAAWWGGLTDYEKAVITAATEQEFAYSYDEATALNGQYLRRMVEEHGVELRDFSEDAWDGFGEAAAEVFEETAAHSDLAARIDAGFQQSLRDLAGYMKGFEVSFVKERNRVLGV